MSIVAHFVGALDVTAGTSWQSFTSSDFKSCVADGQLPAGLKLAEVLPRNEDNAETVVVAGYQVAAAAARTNHAHILAGQGIRLDFDGSSEYVSVAASGAAAVHLIAKWVA